LTIFSYTGLLVNRSCQLFQTKIAYLGYIIEDKISKDLQKVKVIVDAPRPRNAAEVKQFLEMVTYYSRFLQNVFNLIFPLRKLITKSNQYKWTPECEAAFVELKNQIARDQTLIAYDPDLPVIIACDASLVGIGAILSHIIDGKEHLVAFVLRSFTT